MSRTKSYSHYKESCINWLGNVPNHWDTKRLRFLTVVNPSRSELNGYSDEMEVSFVPMEAVGEYGGLRLNEVRTLADVKTGYTYFHDGDVLIAKITPCFENGKGSIAHTLTNGIGFGTTELHVLRPFSELDQRFLFYVTISHAFRNLGAAEMYGAGGQKRVPDDFVRNFRQSLPSLAEQRAIAAFLDQETARIDALIAKKERQIELLQEKRAALISHAVTKGLNPDAPMKDSGIPWLGQVPAHWQVRAMKSIASIGNGSTPSRIKPEYWSEEGFPWLNSSVANKDEVREPIEFVTALALRECHLPRIQPPAVLVGITGQGKTRGMATILRIEATINQHLAFLKPHSKSYDCEYLRRVLDCAYYFLRIESEGAGSTKGAITCEQLANLCIPIPPLLEQEKMVTYMEDRLSRSASLSAKIERSILALCEYRTALISAAVTGRIHILEESDE